MTPMHMSRPPPRSTRAQFGLLRMLLWLCSGFGAAAAAGGLVYLKRASMISGHAFGFPPEYFWGSAVVAALVLALLSGCFDAMLNPGTRKQENHPLPSGLGRSLGLFLLGQMLVAPVVFSFTVVVFDQMGLRI